MDYRQNTLFGDKTIKTISYDQDEILMDILYLHCNGKEIDCDPCYSIGNFYKSSGVTQPKYKFDKYPQIKGVVEADCWNLPLLDETCEVINFDPPFLFNGQSWREDENEDNSKIARRFTSFDNFDHLKFVYYESLKEFFRILKNDGVVIFKLQDQVSGGKQYFVSQMVMKFAVDIGFYPKDLFILLAKSRLIGKINKQQHARKFHSYYWVFVKTKIKIDYEYGLKNLLF